MRFREGIRVALVVVGASALAFACKDSPTGPSLQVPTLPEVAPGSVIIHESFDNENNGVGAYNYTEFEHWDVLAGCVDLHGNGFYDVLAGNGIYVDLDGTCKEAGTIQSKEAFQLEPGVTYTLEFWLAGNQRIERPDTVIVSLGTLYEEQLVLPRNEPFRAYTKQIVVAEPTAAKLRFQNLGGDDRGALLDQVRFRRDD
jgi:hypothetical protein